MLLSGTFAQRLHLTE